MSLWPAVWFDEIDSTNEEAKRRVSNGEFTDSWIASRTQTMGRGRLGRSWISPLGNLYTTALFKFEGSLLDASKLPFVSALAVADAIDAFTNDRTVLLKWPNDVRADGEKISGILIEAGQLGTGCWIAAGIGINVVEAPDTEQPTSSIASLRGDTAVTADMVFDQLRQSFSQRLDQFMMGFETIRQDWLQRAEGLGALVSIQQGGNTLRGNFEDLGLNGELQLRLPDNSLTSITAGDVELIKESVL